MHTLLNRVLFRLAAALVAADAVWLALGHFAIDIQTYGILVLLVVPLAVGAVYYDRLRGEAALSASLACAAFLIVFPAGASLMSYLLITVAGPRIDTVLAAADTALGFHWPAMMALAADHPFANELLSLAYVSVMPQTLVLLLLLGARGDLSNLYGLALALAFGSVITLAVWTAFPSFGAFSVFTLPDAVAAKLGLVLGFDYAHGLVQMLHNGPGFISPKELRGIVGFPSYHTLQALVLIWYARRLPRLRWAVLALNFAVLVAIPVQGGHHLVDMFGGAAVTLAAVALADGLVARARSHARPRGLIAGAHAPVLQRRAAAR